MHFTCHRQEILEIAMYFTNILFYICITRNYDYQRQVFPTLMKWLSHVDVVNNTNGCIDCLFSVGIGIGRSIFRNAGRPINNSRFFCKHGQLFIHVFLQPVSHLYIGRISLTMNMIILLHRDNFLTIKQCVYYWL